MLKKFFTAFLGSMAAIWFSILLLIGILMVVLLLWINGLNQTEVKENSVLYLDFSGEITDRYTPPTMSDVIMGNDDNGPSLDEMLKSVKLAKSDSNIKGIYLNMRGSSMSLAMRQELRTALADFKSSGKWIVAYGDNYSQGDYYTAAVASERYINPSGTLDANGLSATVPFFKNGLDKLGVEIQVIKVGTFKSAVEPYINTEMSEPARLQYDEMLSTMWGDYVNDVVSDLGMPAGSDTVFSNMSAAPMMGFSAAELVDAGLFDATKYAYEVTNMLKTKAGSGDDLNLVTPRDYLASFPSVQLEKIEEDKDHIAVLFAVGDIVDSGSEGIVGDKMAPAITKLADDENVKGLVMRVNSGGGSAFASEQIWAALEYFKSKGKPFVVSMGSAAASGGYYISCGADKIYADPGTITGSIGIFGIIPYAQELLNDKLGINFSVVETNPNAALFQLDRPLTDDQYAALEKRIHHGYDTFINRVATGRGMTEDEVRKIAEGRVWVGSTAMEIGLVDEMGGLVNAIEDVAKRTGLTADDCISYPHVDMSPLELVVSNSANQVASEVSDGVGSTKALERLGLTPEDVKEGNRILKRLRDMNVIQARMEDIQVF